LAQVVLVVQALWVALATILFFQQLLPMAEVLVVTLLTAVLVVLVAEQVVQV
jgi:hypothetical protein